MDRLVELVVTLQRELQSAKRRIKELEPKLGAAATQKIDEPFSVRAEERRQEARGKKWRKRKRPLRRGLIGHRPKGGPADKIARASRTKEVFPVGVSKEDCQLSHSRPVRRLELGQAVLVAYDIYRGPQNLYGKISGVLGRSALFET